MARVTTKKEEVKYYILELTEREANALTELLIAASYDGEGDILDSIYASLCEAGAESDKCSYKVVDGRVVISRASS